MREAKVHIDIHKGIKEQAEEIVKAISPLIPIKFETLKVAIKIQAKDQGKCYSMITKMGEIKKEEWVGADYLCLVEIPGGLRDKLYSSLQNLTQGEVEVRVLRENERSER